MPNGSMAENTSALSEKITENKSPLATGLHHPEFINTCLHYHNKTQGRIFEELWFFVRFDHTLGMEKHGFEISVPLKKFVVNLYGLNGKKGPNRALQTFVVL